MVKELIPEEIIARKIFVIRGQKVMLDRYLAELYGVETKQLTRQVRRNIDRFPSDFMFLLTREEVTNLKRQIGTSSWGGTRKLPMAFAEHGILMLSSVLNSKRAVKVNIQIMRTFVNLRKMSLSCESLRRKVESMEKEYDTKFKVVFSAIKELMDPPPEKPKRRIGFYHD
jgi:hypothetical protein